MPPPHVPAAAQPPQPSMDTANGKFELMKDIGSGNFGVAKLMRDRQTGEMLAVKCECYIKGLHACRGRSALIIAANFAGKSRALCIGACLQRVLAQAAFCCRFCMLSFEAELMTREAWVITWHGAAY